jgi:pimeloyl-ACP methyl ester carboxylesterase
VFLPSLVVAAALGVPAAAAAPDRAPSAAISPRIELESCKPGRAAEDVLCGTLSVFEDRSRAAGRKIDLSIVVLPAVEKTGELEPIFYLEGGPGVAATRDVGLFTTEMRGYRAHHAVVLVDQRGTGHSNGLDCAPPGSPFQTALGKMYPPSYVERCRKDLEQRADLRLYTTPLAADDLDDVRAALGYERIDLLALSYGTRLALVYARQHPEHVGKMVLWGTTPTWATLPLYHAINAQHALDLVLEDCASDESCRREHPNVRAHLRSVLNALGAKPLAVRRGDETGELTADVLAERLRTMLYAPESARQIPALIDQLAAGNTQTLLDALAKPGFPGADGLYLSITCTEDVPRIEDGEAHRVTEGTFTGAYRILQQWVACGLWPRGELPAAYWDNVFNTAPTLLMAGVRDPVTPPTWAAAVAENLAHATLLEIPALAHLPDGLSGLDCFDGVATRFLDRGSLDGADTSCLAAMAPPPFAK